MKSLFASILLATALSMTFMPADAQSRGKSKSKKAKTEAVDSVVTDFDAAPIKVVRDSAQAGNIAAIRAMGTRYYKGTDVEKNDERAAKYWSKAAQEGDPESVARLGICFMNGIGVTPDSLMAIKLFDKALSLKYDNFLEVLDNIAPERPLAAMYLAQRNSRNWMPNDNRDKQEKYLKMASDAGCLDGTRKLGLFYMNTRNFEQALETFKLGAKENDPTSLYYSALLTTEPKFGLPADPTNAIINMRAAAEAGFPQAQNMLGQWYDNGINVTSDKNAARNYYETAAANGNDAARWILGLHYVKGDGYPSDYNIGLNWLTSTTPKVYSKTFKNLFADTATIVKGTHFGDYVQAIKFYNAKDYKNARDLFKSLDKAKRPEAATFIAMCDYNDPSVKYDGKKLVKALQKAAKKNDAYAKYCLATYYMTQEGSDAKQIVSLLNEAAESGLAQAYSVLGELYTEGRLVTADYNAAAAAFDKALVMNGLDNHAATIYADILENGRGGVAVDTDKAKMLRELNPNERTATFINAVPTAIG